MLEVNISIVTVSTGLFTLFSKLENCDNIAQIKGIKIDI